MDDKINTWAPGYFVGDPRRSRMSQEGLDNTNRHESLLVRPFPTGNEICTAVDPDAAAWIAKRLNRANELEAVCKDFKKLLDANEREDLTMCNVQILSTLQRLYEASGNLDPFNYEGR